MGSINAYGALLVAPQAEIRRRRQARRTIWVDYQRVIVNQLAAVWREVSLTKICRDDILDELTLFSRRKWMLLPLGSQLLSQKPSLRSSLPASLGPSHSQRHGRLWVFDSKVVSPSSKSQLITLRISATTIWVSLRCCRGVFFDEIGCFGSATTT